METLLLLAMLGQFWTVRHDPNKTREKARPVTIQPPTPDPQNLNFRNQGATVP